MLLCDARSRLRTWGLGGEIRQKQELPSVEKIGLDGETIYIALSRQADSIKVTGQDHTTLSLARNSSEASYTMTGDDPYARITAYFPRRRGDSHQSVRTIRCFRNGKTRIRFRRIR